MFTRLLRQTYTLLWSLALIVLVLLALYASLGRQYIGLVERYKNEIFQQAEAFSGVQLQASAMRGTWQGLSPVIELLDFQLGDSAALRFDRARIEIDVIGSLLVGRPTIRQIDIGQLNLDLAQADDGRWFIPGLSTEGGGSPDALIDSVLGVRNASLELFAINLHYLNGVQTKISTQDFSLRSDDKFRRAYAKLNTDSDGDIQLLVEAYGDPRNTERFSAGAYMVIKDSRLSALRPLFQDSAALIDSEVSGELWLNWRQGQRVSLNGVLATPALSVGVLWGSHDVVLNDVNMRFSGSHRDGFWRIGFSEFEARWQDLDLDLAGLTASRPEQSKWQFSLPQLDLDVSNSVLLGSDALSPGLQSTLEELAPKGLLRNIQFDLLTSADGLEDFTMRAEARGLSVEAWQGAPAASGLSGYLEIKPKQGKLLLKSDQLALAFPHLYDEAFALQKVSAELNWRYDDERVQVNSGLIRGENGGVPIAALLSLDLPLRKDTEVEPQMSLMIGARDADVGVHERYTPNVLNASLLDWLQESIRGGRAEVAGFIFRGSLLASTDDHPAVQLYLDLADIELAFRPDWPALSAGAAQVFIDNGHVDAWLEGAGQLDGIVVNDLRAAVAPASDGDITLTVSAAAKPNFTQAQRLLTETPLHQYVGKTFDHWQGEGEAVLDFAFSMAFTDDPALAINVDADIDFSSVEMKDYRLSLNAAKGHLHYDTERGLSSRNLRARLFGEPLTAKIKQTGAQLDVDVSGLIAMSDLQRWTAQPIMGFFSGSTKARLHIQTGAEPSLQVNSDLQGVNILLPQPLYKTAEQKRNMNITLPLDSDVQVMQITLAEQLSLLLGFHEGKVFGGDLLLGARPLGSSSYLLTPGQMAIGGRLEFADFDQWRRVFDRYLELAESDGGGESEMMFSASDLRIDELMIFDNLLESVDIGLISHPESWLIHVSSPQLLGDINIPRGSAAASRPFNLTLEHLYLPAPSSGEGSGLAGIDPRTLQSVDLDIKQLYVGGEAWGQLGFDLRSDSGGAHFNNLRGSLRGIELATVAGSSTLHWLQDDSGHVSSQLRGQFGLGDLGGVLQGFGYPKVMETRRGNFDLDLEWPGAPSQWTLVDSAGNFSFSFKDGRFLKSSDAASGTLRIFSIFNMANIVRRLKFDFRDVFKKGIYFDRMRGGLQLGDGQLKLTSPLDVHGPSSRFQMTGAINLQTDVPDLRLVATLPVGSNLPWLAALVGGLPAAAGVYVVSKVFEEQMDSFSSAVYEISGTIQDPELTFKNIFDDEVASPAEAARSSAKPGMQ
ncbi:YhdP family protein [Zhongshania guokunii]|uniref:YhdP family protein n=1 Tax=Zhongshania guokunii TaxID=641783 RepID=A0ABV3U3K6_9GAMM